MTNNDQIKNDLKRLLGLDKKKPEKKQGTRLTDIIKSHDRAMGLCAGCVKFNANGCNLFGVNKGRMIECAHFQRMPEAFVQRHCQDCTKYGNTCELGVHDKNPVACKFFDKKLKRCQECIKFRMPSCGVGSSNPIAVACNAFDQVPIKSIQAQQEAQTAKNTNRCGDCAEFSTGVV